MPQINIKGYAVNYRQVHHGSKGSLIFIHGAGSDGEIWSKLWGNLASEFTVIVPDLPGHNLSEGEPCSAVDDYASSMTAFIKSLNLPRPIIIAGHSMGGAIALSIALTNPELSDGLIMVDSAARLQVLPQFLEQLGKGILDGNFLDFGFAASTPEAVKKDFLDYAAQVPVSIYFIDFTACSKFDVREQLDQLHCPLLLLVGNEDRLTPVKLSEFIKGKVHPATMKVIPQAGHFTMLEQPQALSQAINEFVSHLAE